MKFTHKKMEMRKNEVFTQENRNEEKWSFHTRKCKWGKMKFPHKKMEGGNRKFSHKRNKVRVNQRWKDRNGSPLLVCPLGWPPVCMFACVLSVDAVRTAHVPFAASVRHPARSTPSRTRKLQTSLITLPLEQGRSTRISIGALCAGWVRPFVRASCVCSRWLCAGCVRALCVCAGCVRALWVCVVVRSLRVCARWLCVVVRVVCASPSGAVGEEAGRVRHRDWPGIRESVVGTLVASSCRVRTKAHTSAHMMALRSEKLGPQPRALVDQNCSFVSELR